LKIVGISWIYKTSASFSFYGENNLNYENLETISLLDYSLPLCKALDIYSPKVEYTLVLLNLFCIPILDLSEAEAFAFSNDSTKGSIGSPLISILSLLILSLSQSPKCFLNVFEYKLVLAFMALFISPLYIYNSC
jgi:hypothetical protein